MLNLAPRLVKSFGIGLSALLLSTLGIAASDELSGISSRLKASLGEAEQVCDSGSVLVAYGTHAVCMDVYEAAAGEGCLYPDPQSELETEVNVANPKCRAESIEGRLPWRYVSYTEAALMCARSGKRLPTNDGWCKVALGLSDLDTCVLHENKAM